MQEQAADVQRQAQLKINARAADERWAAKAKYIEKPKPTTTMEPATARGLGKVQPRNDPNRPSPTATTANSINGKEDLLSKGDDTTEPVSTWTPEAWTPGAAKR